MSDEVQDPTGIRYYGGDMTIHGNDSLDVEVDKHGKVVAVWFRCQPLPFRQSLAAKPRADEMGRMYGRGMPGVDAVVLRESDV